MAARVFAAFESRAAIVNAVPWQTFFVAVGEALPGLTDAMLTRFPDIVGGEPAPAIAPPVPPPRPATAPALTDEMPSDVSALESALRDQSARMKKLNLSATFVRGILQPDTELDLGEVAMRWAGMPNKHERALTADVLDALAEAGYLARIAPERYRVVKAATD